MAHQDMEALASSAQASPAELAACSLLYTEDVLKNSAFLNFSDTQKQEFVNALSPLAKLALALVDKSLSWVLDLSEYDSMLMRVYRHSNFYTATCDYESDILALYSTFKREGCVRYNFSSDLLNCLNDENKNQILSVLRATESPSCLESNYLPDSLCFGDCFEKDMDEEYFDLHLFCSDDGVSCIDEESFDSLMESIRTLLEASPDRDGAIDFISSKDCDDWDAIEEALSGEDENNILEDMSRFFDLSDSENSVNTVQVIKEFLPFDVESSALKDFLCNLDGFEDLSREPWSGHEIVEPGSPIFNYLYDDGFQPFTWEVSSIHLENYKSGHKLTLME